MLASAVVLALLLQPPTPQPFPKPGSPAPTRPEPGAQQPGPGQPTPGASGLIPAPPASGTPGTAAPSEATLGVQLPPGSQFITSYDAGRGQRFYLFGTAGSFVSVVTYYRTL